MQDEQYEIRCPRETYYEWVGKSREFLDRGVGTGNKDSKEHISCPNCQFSKDVSKGP